MDTRDVVDRYYQLANRGEWDAWTDLFAEDQVMDEQLSGRIEGQDALREIMRGFPAAYPSFKNIPRRFVIDGGEAAVISHISATTAQGATIEVDAANYFRVSDGRIVYMTNVHDTVPFRSA